LGQRKSYKTFVVLFLLGDVLAEPVFECFKDKVGKFRFRLKAVNGEIIAISEAYTSKDACMNGVESVKKNAPIAKVVEVKE
jgi:uncharacterized protein YegP (UPF0339 family)